MHLALLLIAAIALFGCGRSQRQPAVEADSTSRQVATTDTTESRGASIYRSKCSFCHQPNGLGVGRSYPPLAGSELVTGDAAMLARIIINGMQGPVVVKGTKYDNTMPGWRNYLPPADIAEVINYVRSSWGNHASVVTTAFVDSLQRATASQPDPINLSAR
jgi:mono/diheme cytochrome c family protein